eukprot:9185196-Alexandrium_andersonii.AAC.1
MARPSKDERDGPTTPVSAPHRCISIDWAKACSGHASLPWRSDKTCGARVAPEGSGQFIGDIGH